MRTMTAQEIGWLAGIIEGEGHIRIRPDKRAIEITVRMGDKDVIERVYAVTRVGAVYGPYWRGNPKHKPESVWTCGQRNDVLDIFDVIEPLMGERRSERIQEARAHVGNERIIPARCGTTAGYQRHLSLGETTCRACRDVINTRHRQQRKQGTTH